MLLSIVISKPTNTHTKRHR